MNLQEKLVQILKKEDKQAVNEFASYCLKGQIDTKRPWFKNLDPQQFADLFMKVKAEGLIFDGKHITFQSRGISYDYVAYKNKMLLVYPESKIDMAVVLEGDIFNIEKKDGKVIYSHKIKDAFADPTEASITGAYCVIKNKRGEFETVLSKAEIIKHRNSAKTKFIWNAWYKEMVLKTVIKKAVKYHFDDTFVEMDEEDNKNIDPANALKNDTSDDVKKINNSKTLDELKKIFISFKPEIRNRIEIIGAKEKMKIKLTKGTKKITNKTNNKK